MSSSPIIGSTVLPFGTEDIVLDRLFPAPDPHLDDPVGWIHARLGEETWSKQDEVLESIRDHRFTAVKACHGPGKSWTAARAAAWWLDVHDLGTAFAVTTAPSWSQVEAILWREIRRAHRKGGLRGRVTLDCQWHMSEREKHRKTSSPDEELIAIGRKPQDYDQTAFQGIHARYVLVIIDEASGIPPLLWEAVETLVTNEFSRVLAIGNPDDPASEFEKICRPESDYNVITISAFDTPAFTGEPVSQDLLDVLTAPIWVEERRKKWGEGSMLWVSKVLGEFPEVSEETMFPPYLLKRAMINELPGIDPGRYGADIARFGEDMTVVYRNRGGVVRLEHEHARLDTETTADTFLNILAKHGPNRVPMVVDVVGVGAGVYDKLRRRNAPVSQFNASWKPYDSQRFLNRRAEVYWRFRELLEDFAIDLDPEDEELINQLGSIRYQLTNTGKIQIEGKDDMKLRGLPSPDRADAAIMSTVATWSVREHQERNEGIVSDSLTGDLMSRPM